MFLFGAYDWESLLQTSGVEHSPSRVRHVRQLNRRTKP